MRNSKLATMLAIIALSMTLGTARIWATDDENRLSNIVDAAGMFNERGYSKANSFSLSGNEVINDFNGNLMYTQRLMYLPVSENGLHCDLKLAYNGNVSHTAFGARSGMNGIYQTPVNLPEWILSINGIAVQTFNFENELVSWRSNTQGDTISYDDDVAAHVEGYHKCYRETSDHFHGIISILMEDGSVREFYSVSNGISGPAFMIGGEYNSCSKDDPDRGYLWPVSSPHYGEFTLFRSDGTKVDFKVYQPKYRSDVNCSEAFPASREDYPRILLPLRFRDEMGHTLSLTHSYVAEGDSVWGRPILSTAGNISFDWTTWVPGISNSSNTLEVRLNGNGIYTIDFAGIPPDPGVISSKAVSWKYDACRGMVYSIDTQQQEPTIFTYRSYARNYKDLKMGPQLEFNICGPASSKYAGRAYQVTPWRIWKIQYPEGGKQFIQYYADRATAWGQNGNLGAVDTLSISYDHSENCMTNQVPKFPCKKSAAFDDIGRDPFFLNMVAATRRTLDGVEVVNTDSLEYSWDDETADQVIGSDDQFFTKRWFGGESPDGNESSDQVKERRLTYRYFPEKGTFSSRSRDRGWVMKMESSVEKDSRYSAGQTRKDYYWNTDCADLICYGTFQLDSLKTTHDTESYWERYSYYWFGDPSLETVNNLTRKEIIDPWGIKTETRYSTGYLSLANPETAYYNSNLVSDAKTWRVSDNILLKHQSLEYHSAPATGGFAGQLQSSTDYLLDEQGLPTLTVVNRFQYNTNISLGTHCGSTRWHIDPMGDTTFYYYSSGTESVTYTQQAHDGSVESFTRDLSFGDSGPFWFKKVKRCGLQDFTWYRKVDERGRLLWLVEPNGFRSELTYDDLNRVHKIILPGGYLPSSKDSQIPPGPQDTAWSVWNFYDDEYDEYVPDPVSIKQLIRVDHSQPSRESRVWIDGLSRPYRHDQRNSDGSYDSVVVGYDFAGRAVSEIDQLGFVTTTAYDHLDRAVKTNYPDPTHSSDSVKYMVTNAAATGLTSRFNFPETIIFKSEYRDENGHIVNEYSDVRGNLRLHQTYDGETPLSTYYDYDDLGNLTLIIKPMGDSVRYTYNSLGQLTSEQNSDLSSWAVSILYKYDKIGNLVSRQDPNLYYCDMPPCPPEKWQRFGYDNLNRLVESAVEVMADKGGGHQYVPATRNFYDQSNCELSKGRLSLAVKCDPDGICSYAERYDYDPRGRVKKQVNYFNAVLDSTLVSGSNWEYGAHGDSVVLSYAYDWADQLRSLTYPDGSIVRYDYDTRGRLISVGGAPPSESDRYARLAYTKRDRLESMRLGGGLQQLDYAYNERGWLTSINEGISYAIAPADMFGQSLYYYSHPGGYVGWPPQYNGNLFGQKTSICQSNLSYAYNYDESDRLKEAYLGGARIDGFAFDANGNITQRSKWQAGDEVTKDYRYRSGTNKLEIIDLAHSLLDDTLSYDAMGNVTRHSGKKASMIYDEFNQLVMVVVKTGLGADTIRYAYDAGGNRIFKGYTYQFRARCSQQSKAGGEADTGGEDPRFPPIDTTSLYCTYSDTKNTYYIRSQSGQVLAEQSTPSPLTATAKFLYAGGQRIGMRDAGNKLHYFLNDHLGSTRLVIDSTGLKKDLHNYYPFGEILGEVTATNQSYRYTGKPLDKEAGLNLYYYGARYYDPELGRFLAIDPAASKYPSLSPYAYCANNPLKNVDPDGRVIETAVDVVSVVLSAVDMWNDPSWSNLGWLALDVGAAVAPFVPAVGAVRHAEKIGDVAKALLGTENAVDAAKTAEKAVDAGTDAAKAADKAKTPKQVRNEFPQVRRKYWQDEAAKNPGKYSAEDLERMKKGKPPLGNDGKPVELHHHPQVTVGGDNSIDNLTPMNRRDHREGENYRKNHPRVGPEEAE